MQMNKDKNFTIREANANDVDTILALIRGLAEYENLAHELKTTPELLFKYGFGDSPYFHTILCEKNINSKTIAVGFALYFFTFSTFLSRPTLYLEDLFVLPEHRGNGYGLALFKSLAQIAEQKECGRIEWAVLNWNEPALNFYKSLGAYPQSEWTTYRLDSAAIKNLLVP